MLEEATDSSRQAYLLTSLTPKSEDQLVWERDIRAVVGPLLTNNGEHLLIPGFYRWGEWEDFIQRTKERKELLDRLPRGIPIISGILYMWNNSEDVITLSKIEVAKKRYEELPFYKVERLFGDSEHKAEIQSRHLYWESVIKEAFTEVYKGDKDPNDPLLFPILYIEYCELHFRSTAWKSSANSRVISPSGEGYEQTSAGLELPLYAREQIEAIVAQFGEVTSKGS